MAEPLLFLSIPTSCMQFEDDDIGYVEAKVPAGAQPGFGRREAPEQIYQDRSLEEGFICGGHGALPRRGGVGLQRKRFL
jgi:hypothetical protein